MKTLYDYLEEKKWSMKDLAEQINLSPNYLYSVIKGSVPMSKKVLRSLKKVSNGKITEEMIKACSSVCRCCGRPL